MKKQNATKRNLFAELMEGVDAMGAHRDRKVTLRTQTVSSPVISIGVLNARSIVDCGSAPGTQPPRNSEG